MQGLFNIAAAIVGALIGSVVGVLLTNSRVRKERGFDRRLQWCESMMGALNAAGAAVTSATAGRDPKGREECWTEVIRLEVIRLYEKLIPLSGQKELYAPKRGIELIQTFMSKLSELIESHLTALPTKKSVVVAAVDVAADDGYASPR